MEIKYSQIVEVFGSKLKADEVLYLLVGIKPTLRQLFFSDELVSVLAFCKRNGLFVVESPFKIIFSDAEESFSNKGERVQKDDSQEGAVVLYISQDEELAYRAALAEAQGDHLLLGELLGYPSCCIEYFIKQFSSENPNPELSLGNGGELPKGAWVLATQFREKDAALLSHFPCAWNCTESLNIASQRMRFLEETISWRLKEIQDLCERID